MKIIGAGLSGCLAGVLVNGSKVYEAGPNKNTHQSLLRFRTPDIAKAIGIEFKKVKVYKGIWHNDCPVALSPRYINLYSRKVSDSIAARSICNLDTVDRYICNNFLDILKDILGDRIRYNSDIVGHVKYCEKAIISTIPINILSKMLGNEIKIPERKHPSIYVTKYNIEECDIYMTYYFTDPTTVVYRASITGNELIIESNFPIELSDKDVVMRAFGLTGMVLNLTLDNYKQLNGKLVAIDEDIRKDFVANTTIKYNIYSLGRLANWRNLILDDIYNDINQIKKWSNKSHYDRMVQK